jgi:hypothetical protein
LISRFFGLVYVILGLIVANSHGYLAIKTLGNALVAILAIFLWPLVLLGVDLHLGIG